MGIDLTAGRVRRPAWVAHVFDEPEAGGEDQARSPHAVLLHLPRGERVALSDTATAVWQLIVASGEVGVRTGDMVAVLADQYQVDPTIVDHDISSLVGDLLRGDWLEFVPDSDD